jgi:hypothetical protein
MIRNAIKHNFNFIFVVIIIFCSLLLEGQKWNIKVNPFPLFAYVYLEEQIAPKTSLEYYFGKHSLYTEDFGLSHYIFGLSLRQYFKKDLNTNLNGFYLMPNMSFFAKDKAYYNHFVAGLSMGYQINISKDWVFDVGFGRQYNFGQGSIASNNRIRQERFFPRARLAIGYRF